MNRLDPRATRLPKQAKVVDGRGQYLIPGLWDMHVHVASDDHALRLLLASGIPASAIWVETSRSFRTRAVD